MKWILSFIAAIAALAAACAVASGGRAFLRENFRKYITLRRTDRA